MKNLLFGLGLLMLMPFVSHAQQVPRSLTASNGVFIGFYEYKPPAYNTSPTRKFPLIIFLHGIGERGDGSSSLSAVLNVGIPRNIHYGLTDMTFNYNGAKEEFLVLSPQLSFNYGNWQAFYIQAMIDYAKANLNVDPNRIYLTGLSLGGGGVWNYASSSAQAAKNLAAIAPICGTCDWSNLCNISQNALPVWAFHAMDDGVVGVGCTQTAIYQINACSPSVAPITTYYPTGNHWIWDQVYDPANPQLYLWFLSKSRGAYTPPPTGGGGSNVAPVANAGSAQTITLPTNSVNLSGSGSYDSDGTITNYTWSQVSGPGTASFVNSTAANTSVGGLLQGSYVFRLTVKDNAGATATSDVTITVNAQAPAANTPPVAVASADQTITLPTNSVFLLGSGSYDPGGYISTYAWTQRSGPNTATTAVVSNTNLDVKNLVAGTYVFRLTVTDNQGATGYDDVTVTVNGGAAATPVANAGSNQTLTLPTNSTTLNGSGSVGATSYNWTETAGPTTATIATATSATPTVSGLVAGTYTFKLTVSNTSGQSSSADVQVTVTGTTSGNTPPVAVAGNNQTITLPTNTVWLQGSGSYDQGGYITDYVWTQQSGPSTATLTAISNTNSEAKNLVAGTYVFKLTVTDNGGATASSTVSITVNGTNPPPTGGGGAGAPVAVAGNNQTITLPTNSVFLAGSGSYDAGGWITNYAWTQQSGPNNATITSISNSNIEVKNMIAGTYVFKLTVTDNSGLTASATVTVTVNGTNPPPAGGGAGAPVAVAGNTQYITLPTSTVWLQGSGSYDAGGWITNYVWTQESGPGNATMVSISNTNVEARNLVPGVYTFKLTVTDNSGLTGSATVQVYVYGNNTARASTTTSASTDVVTSTSNTTSNTLISGTNTLNTSTALKSSGTNGLTLYPNPVTTTMNVQVNNDILSDVVISVFNQSGNAIKTIKASKTSTQFSYQVNMQDVPSGTYVVEIRFADGTRLTGQVIKQ